MLDPPNPTGSPHTPILATLLSGVASGPPSPGPVVNAFREALQAHTPGSDVEIEQIDEALRIFGEASVTFSDPGRALAWLSSSSEVFGGKTPLAMMHSDGGRQEVRAQLLRIEHGIYF